MPQKVLIVGGVAGGATAAARLRRLDEHAEIIMFERGEYISFANCGLPYYIGGEITEKAALTIQTPENFKTLLNVEVRVYSEVTEIHRDFKTITVKNLQTNEIYTESYDKLILSPGAVPVRPNIPGITSEKVFTLRNIPDTYKIKDYIDTHKPKRAAVIGGGYIGVEMVENLQNAGLSVTLVEMLDQVIAPLDYDMACEVHRYMISKGVNLILKNGVKAISDNGERLTVTLNEGELQTDLLIMAVGVRPESGLAKAAGLVVSERGCIVVDDTMRTSDADIYAVGDAVEVSDFVTGQKGFIPLAGPANKQGRIAADQICGIESRYVGTQGSAILKLFDMTVATTGINEKTAKRLGLDYDKSFTYSASHASYYPGAINMSVKVVYEKSTGRILGAQIIGFDGVDKRCDILATAIRAGMTAYDLTELELCYAPPYSSVKDPVNMAGFVIENQLKGRVKHFHWHDVDALPHDGSITLLDVRTAMEYANGTIDGFVNIPVADLRSKLSTLDKSKKVYVICQVGLKGYMAARILTQEGFDVYNLNGGYRVYNTVLGKKAAPPPAACCAPAAQAPPPRPKGATGKVIKVNACGIQCPGPVVKLSAALNTAKTGDVIEMSASDPAFAADIEAFCRRTGHSLLGLNGEKGITVAKIEKCEPGTTTGGASGGNAKNFIVFSGELDKAIASFIMANAAAAMGRKTSMFFTFWGLNILRKPQKVHTDKDLISRMFGMMMPRGSQRLKLSKLNMGGMGAMMIRSVMKKKNVDSLEQLIRQAMENGVELVACSMSMDVMGIKENELIDGIKIGGAAAMLANAEESDMSLFI